MKPRLPSFSLWQRRQCLLPTWRGVLLAAVLSITAIVAVARSVHPFLATNEPVPAELLVVEGWVPDDVLQEAKREFVRGRYQRLYVTGGPLMIGAFLSEHKTYANVGAASLRAMGMN